MSTQTCLILPSSSSSYSSWIEWHKALKKCVGKANANQLWMMNFDKEMPGDNVEVNVELIVPIAMEERLRFAIREGGRTVGAGIVAEILE